MFEVDDIFQDKNILTGYQLTENNTLYRDPFMCKHLNIVSHDSVICLAPNNIPQIYKTFTFDKINEQNHRHAT